MFVLAKMSLGAVWARESRLRTRGRRTRSSGGTRSSRQSQSSSPRAHKGPGALILEGEAGAGKTTIWTAATAEAAEQGFRVLASRPGRSETKLSFSALDDLLRPVVDEVGHALPGPQRRALDTVLLRGPDSDSGADARTVARAALETVRLLTAAGPVAVAVDDVQWLDHPSALVLEYVARRLTDEPVALVLTSRTESVAAAALGLDRSPWPERVRRLPVGALDAGALHVVIERHVGISLTRPVLRVFIRCRAATRCTPWKSHGRCPPHR